jgi:hypothetical protein
MTGAVGFGSWDTDLKVCFNKLPPSSEAASFCGGLFLGLLGIFELESKNPLGVLLPESNFGLFLGLKLFKIFRGEILKLRPGMTCYFVVGSGE